MRVLRRARGAVLATVALAGLTCTGRERPLPPCDASSALPTPPRDPNAVQIVTVGDIADCATDASEHTAALVKKLAPDAVLALGDLAYPDGSLEDYLGCYDRRWGDFRGITRAAVGNHEYHTPHAGPFYAYFCGSSGQPFRGWYSFELGTWHVVVLNSNCGADIDVSPEVPEELGGCDVASPQATWLRADLAAHPKKCTLAMWHHPRFNSGPHGSDERLRDVFQILYDAGADVVLSGHAHDYERFAPQDAAGNADAARGLRQFVVGTGGRSLAKRGNPAPQSEILQADSFGVLSMTLLPDRYQWKFVPIDGATFHDEGEAECH